MLPPFKRRFAVVIGINNYQKGIAKLQTATHDAVKLSQILEDNYSYNVSLFLDESATKNSLEELLYRTLPDTFNLTDEDCLLFYFAGHGIARNHDEKGPVGYLIPQDARPETTESFLPMQQVIEALSNLQCRHLLLIADCCFAGAFRWASSRQIDIVPGTVHKQRYDRFVKFPAWQVLTSAAHNQNAIDLLQDNRVLGDLTTKIHSPFAQALFSALRGDGDLNDDGLITATELYLYLRDHVEISTGEKQSPGIWPLRKHRRGEYLFVREDFDRDQLKDAPTLSAKNNPYRGLKTYEACHADMFFGRDELITALHENYVALNPLTIVLGASGTGKSSLVKAGLVAYLQNREKERGAFLQGEKLQSHGKDIQQGWQVLPPLRPGNEPLAALAQAILPICNQPFSSKETEAIRRFDKMRVSFPKKFLEEWIKAKTRPSKRLSLVLEYYELLEEHFKYVDSCRQNSECKQSEIEALESLKACAQVYLSQIQTEINKGFEHLANLIAVSSAPDDHIKSVLIIDQAEELITQKPTSENRQRFLHYIGQLLDRHHHHLRCVVTIRIDFEDLVKRYLPKSIESKWTRHTRFIVPPMSQVELRQAIEGPANKNELNFEPYDLVDKLISEVSQMPGSLPLLSFTLSELYLKCSERFESDVNPDRTLIESDYQQLGGVVGSLRKRINTEFTTCSDLEQQMFKKIMLRMVALESGELARRSVLYGEIEYIDEVENDCVRRILKMLVEKRLLVSGKSGEGRYVEPAHDAIVRGWEKIPEWLNETVEIQPELTIKEKILSNIAGWKNKARERRSVSETQLAFNLGLQRDLTSAAERWKAFRDTPERYKYLWTRDPRLLQAKQVRNAETSEDNWLSKLETVFVENSLRRRKALSRRWFVGIASIFTIITSAAGVAMWQRREAVISQIETLTKSSEAGYAADKLLIDPLIDAMTAGKKLNQTIGVDAGIGAEVVNALYSSAHSVREQNILEGKHKDNINDVAYSPDGELVATGGLDSTVNLWSSDGLHLHTLAGADGHTDEISSVSFSPDSQIVATASFDSTVKLWNREGKYLQTLRGHGENVFGVTFSPDAQFMVTGSSDKTAKIWTRQNGRWRQLRTLSGHEAMISTVSVSPDNQTIATSSYDQTVRLWTREGEPISTLKHDKKVSSVSFTPDNKVVTAGFDGMLRFWDASGEFISEFRAHDENITQVIVSSDGQFLATSSWDSTVRIWNKDGKRIYELTTRSSTPTSISFSPHGRAIAIGHVDATARIWNLENSQLQLLEHFRAIKSLDFSQDGQLIATASWINKSAPTDEALIKIWSQNLGYWQEHQALHRQMSGVRRVGFHPTNKNIIATVSNDGKLSLWNLSEPELEPYQTFEDHWQDNVEALSFSPDGQKVVTAAANGAVVLRHLDKEMLQSFTVEVSGGFLDVQFSLDSRILATTSQRNVKLWRREDESGLYEEYKTLEGHESDVYAVSFSPDGELIATASDDQTFKIWTDDGQLIDTVRAHNLPVTSIDFSPDSQLIVTGSDDRTVKLWDRNGELVRILQAHTSEVKSVQFSPTGDLIATAGNDGRLFLWNVDLTLSDLDKLMEYSCRLARNYLSNNINVDREKRKLCAGVADYTEVVNKTS